MILFRRERLIFLYFDWIKKKKKHAASCSPYGIHDGYGEKTERWNCEDMKSFLPKTAVHVTLTLSSQ